VDDWLRASSTSKPRKGRHREGPEVVARLGVEVAGGRGPALLDALAEACTEVGVRVLRSPPRSPTKAPRHVAIASLRPALLGPKVHVDLRFDPPIHPSSAARILERLKQGFQVTKVSMTEARTRLPPRGG
jgi:hypothetical protein